MKEENRWTPTDVDEIRNNFVFNNENLLKSNIAYNIQYIQYLYRDIENNDSPAVLFRMRYKTFIIIGMSIIEGLFMALLKNKGLIPLEEWKEVGKHKHVQIDSESMNVIIKRKKVKPFEKKIKFDEAIFLIKKNNILQLNQSSIDVIKKLQDLRNHLHLDKAKETIWSDYNCFDEKRYFVMKYILFYILSNKDISKKTEYIEFLRPLKIDLDKYIK